MVRYKPKTSPAELREEYQFRHETMRINYGRKFEAEQSAKRASNFEEGYRELRWKVVEFVRGIFKYKPVPMNMDIPLQNKISEAVSAYNRLGRGSAFPHLLSCMEIIGKYFSLGILDAEDIRKIYTFLEKEGVPRDDIVTAHRMVSVVYTLLPAP